ncbi:PTS sugar transporter [Cryobacterium sp. PH31-AA6]|uniref:PTS sugar transporter subunit IIB n=1 Tax=Cryobacterium sp. PH31-AA6 TaxID=3046205 RepID=UPI0024BBB454|nr:PTS sugar transporter [Cryobacterium sp. PH31-AA6]MDJ0324098.1 PTS sugar transporter [Cryobacterium sp. PH31-AA6]
MRILVVCGAGASSTFVALRMRQTAVARGLALDVSAGSESDLPDALDGVDVLLVGPHLAPRFDEFTAQAERLGVGCALLPSTIFTARDGNDALDLALGTVSPGINLGA